MSETVKIAAAIIMTIGCTSCARSFLRAYKEEDHDRAFRLKGAAALCFVAVGMLMALRCIHGPFAWKIVIGLAFGLVGDELLALRFIYPDKHDLMFALGAVSFALGHGFYVAALLTLDGGIIYPALPIMAVGLLLSLIYGRYSRSNAGGFQPFGIIYIAIVVFVASAAAAAAVRGFSIGLLLFAAGGVCFAVSDNLLFAYSFGKSKRNSTNVAVHATYYAAQLLIGWSMAFI